jgi:hypothetical protein
VRFDLRRIGAIPTEFRAERFDVLGRIRSFDVQIGDREWGGLAHHLFTIPPFARGSSLIKKVGRLARLLSCALVV